MEIVKNRGGMHLPRTTSTPSTKERYSGANTEMNTSTNFNSMYIPIHACTAGHIYIYMIFPPCHNRLSAGTTPLQ